MAPQYNHIVLPTLGQCPSASARQVFLALKPQTSPARALYIHIPFCSHKCDYCDFYSLVDTRDRQNVFTDRLIRELRALGSFAPEPLNSIFIGGGTPSLLDASLWERLLGELNDSFDLSRIQTGQGEFTVECNPESTTPEFLGILKAGSVDRVSFGAQSFEPEHLKTLQRLHDPDRVELVIIMAQDAGIVRQSLDLIYAIPGQTLRQWQRDLQRAVAIGVEHISCYNLTYEPATAMTARLNQGEFTPADEDLEIQSFELAGKVLGEAGLMRYEISNFAQKGCESLHNLAYWRSESWLAAGPAAAAHVGGHRYRNTPHLGQYLDFDDQGFAPIMDHEQPDTRRALAERLMMGLRLVEGVDSDPIYRAGEQINEHLCDQLRECVLKQIEAGLMAMQDGRWQLTDAGLLLTDGIVAELMDVVYQA